MRIFRKENRDIFATIESFETRLDNILFRSHFAESIFEARRLISKKMVLVNGKLVKIPGTYINVGDMVSIRKEHWPSLFNSVNNPFRKIWGFVPNYLDVNFMSCSAILIKRPQYEEIPIPFPRSLIEAAGNFFTRRS